MDDFEFPVVDDGILVGTAIDEMFAEGHDDVPFQHLATLPTDQLPRSEPIVNGSSLGGCLRGVVLNRRSSIKVDLPSRKSAATPFVGSAAPSTALVPPLNGDEVALPPTAAADLQPVTEKYVWMPSRVVRPEWSFEETNEFYDGIAQFGTNFASIAILFPGKTREDIVHKFKLESRKRPDRIHQAMTAGQRPVNMEKFQACKKRCDELTAEPVRVLDAEEEAHLKAIDVELVASLSQQPTPSHSHGSAPAAKLEHISHPDVGPSPSIQLTSSGEHILEFAFDEDDDVPMAELYTTKRQREKRKREKEISPLSVTTRSAKSAKAVASAAFAAETLPSPASGDFSFLGDSAFPATLPADGSEADASIAVSDGVDDEMFFF